MECKYHSDFILISDLKALFPNNENLNSFSLNFYLNFILPT